MPTERMEVEVVCDQCAMAMMFSSASGGRSAASTCDHHPDNNGIETATVAPNSLTAARLRLADAAEAHLTNFSGDTATWNPVVGAFRALKDLRESAALRTARGA